MSAAEPPAPGDVYAHNGAAWMVVAVPWFTGTRARTCDAYFLRDELDVKFDDHGSWWEPNEPAPSAWRAL